MPSYQAEQDSRQAMCGVPGRWIARTTHPEKSTGDLWFNQKWISETRNVPGQEGRRVRAEIRFDDQCGNKHNTFSVTGTIYTLEEYSPSGRRLSAPAWQETGGGCVHDDIAAAFPELAHLIRWHLVSTDGPMHYVANAVYHAGDRDHHGKRKGEPWAWDRAVRFGDNPIVHKLRDSFAKFLVERHAGDPTAPGFAVVAIAHDGKGGYATKFAPKWTFAGYGEKWHECPFDSQEEAQAFADALARCKPEFLTVPTQWSEGKPRELDHARSTAVWPEVTDAELITWSDDGSLKQRLLDRAPALLAAFRADVEAAGFWWTPVNRVQVAA